MNGRPSLGTIDDYTRGALAPDDERRFEEALFEEAAEGRATDLVFLDGLERAAPWFRARGGFVNGLSRAKLEELRRGPDVHYLDLHVNEPVTIDAWPSSTRLVVYRIDVDLRGYSEVEVHLDLADGTSVKTFRDVAYEPADGAIYFLCEEPLARATLGTLHTVARIEAARDGKRTTVATFETKPAS